jgi:hypothetical protein
MVTVFDTSVSQCNKGVIKPRLNDARNVIVCLLPFGVDARQHLGQRLGCGPLRIMISGQLQQGPAFFLCPLRLRKEIVVLRFFSLFDCQNISRRKFARCLIQ